MDLFKYDVVVINTSAGKDSQTMLGLVVKLAAEQGYPLDRVLAVHADLGDVEWAGTAELAKRQADFYGVELEIVRRELGDLLDQVRSRGMWPSSTNRYCTSDQKRDQVSKVITRLQREGHTTFRRRRGDAFKVLNCMGLRAQESAARAKRLELERNIRLTTKTRVVDNWHPILDWTARDVWEFIKSEGAPYHYAYDLGMPRLSCVFCIFAPKAELVTAARHNPGLLERYVELEAEIGHRFRQDLSMADVKAAADAGGDAGEIPAEGWAA